MRWIHVLNQHKGHPRVRWQRFQQSCECFQTSGRSSDSDHRKDSGLAGPFSVIGDSWPRILLRHWPRLLAASPCRP